eukprot:CAMPEP_0114499250 /NCGR_PEP_ID=MMETSP0109-20121206/7315_1 /TAXON_ID=29199 /ORGANISM="Chlorarachnion reptans, Strain CCCM449" /LENGTH=379 /DNA_ID=CAMNT_0001676801 /DNA_START=171 /DNA_END=1307 /DNA_ORIENTATION=-
MWEANANRGLVPSNREGHGEIRAKDSLAPNVQKPESVGICSILRDEDRYIMEWLDYHHGLGVAKFYLYDNSDEFTLQDLRRDDVELIHYPNKNPDDAMWVQRHAYNDCIRRFGPLHDSLGFLDLDEFVVLHQHSSLPDMLREHLRQGVLSINWVPFGSNGETQYHPMPVTKRFTSDPKYSPLTKAFARPEHILNFTQNPHVPNLKEGYTQHDVCGLELNGPRIPADLNCSLRLDATVVEWAPRDDIGTPLPPRNNKKSPITEQMLKATTAVIFHYHSKSREEFMGKCCARGYFNREDEATMCSEYAQGMKRREPVNTGFFEAWNFLKTVSPKYEVCDEAGKELECAALLYKPTRIQTKFEARDSLLQMRMGACSPGELW